MSRDVDPQQWQPFIQQVCSALSVAPGQVDVGVILDLAGAVSGEIERPMAPVAAYILGLAVGTIGPTADAAALARQLLDAAVTA